MRVLAALRMPLDRVDQLPLPNLHIFTVFSGLGLFYALVYSLSAPDGLYQTFTTDVWCAAVSVHLIRVCTTSSIMFTRAI